MTSTKRVPKSDKGNTRILVNHVGFLPQGAKHVVIVNPPEKKFEVVKCLGTDSRYKISEIAYTGQLKRVNAELGDGWVGDFSTVRDEGIYKILCGKAVSRLIVIYGETYDQMLRVLFNYYPTQRCGDSRTGWHAPCHVDDAYRDDTGEHVDLVGGWHQSGDLRKWMMGTPLGLSGLSQLGLLHNPRWDEGQIADELRWGNRYFHKMIRPDGGLMEHVVFPGDWSSRKVYPNDPPPHGSYMTIIGQALATRYMKERDPEHSRKCLAAARRIWNYMSESPDRHRHYSPAILPPDHDWLKSVFNTYCTPACGDALYAAIKLFEVTGETIFCDQACKLANELVSLQVGGDIEKDLAAACFYSDSSRKELAMSSLFGPAGLAELLLLRPDHPDSSHWRRAVLLIAEQKCRMAEQNPWGLIPPFWCSDTPGTTGRPGGSGLYRYFFRHQGLVTGSNLDITTAGIFLLRAHLVTGDMRYLAAAQRQVDWILGCNPFDISTVEGVGLNQPQRFINVGYFFPPTPQIPGGVMTGIFGDTEDNPIPFINNCSTEYDLPPNAALIWLLCELSTSKVKVA
ncbi:MAG: glycoside hydrolase family 9 protein [Kiritimatiellae bacterium]|nr:glycoside hydrolase family 9 protein [Verrucomicrobiota bacterium]MCG2659951.1 glycoside hydrolase family 9 protein [Kiritimatiellia bacterium]